jgi:hypothetical protein
MPSFSPFGPEAMTAMRMCQKVEGHSNLIQTDLVHRHFRTFPFFYGT